MREWQYLKTKQKKTDKKHDENLKYRGNYTKSLTIKSGPLHGAIKKIYKAVVIPRLDLRSEVWEKLTLNYDK